MDVALKKQRLVVLDLDDCLAQMFADEGPVLKAIINDFYKPRLTKQEFETLKQRVSVEKEPLCYDYRSYYNQIVGKDFSVEDLKQWHEQNTELLLKLPVFEGVDQGLEQLVLKHKTVIITYRDKWWGYPSIVKRYTLQWLKSKLGFKDSKIKVFFASDDNSVGYSDKPSIVKDLIKNSGFESVVVLEDFPTVITQYLQALPGFANLKMFVVKHNWNASTVFDEKLPESLLSEKQAFLSFIKQYLYNSSRDNSSKKASLAYVHVQELRDLLLHL